MKGNTHIYFSKKKLIWGPNPFKKYIQKLSIKIIVWMICNFILAYTFYLVSNFILWANRDLIRGYGCNHSKEKKKY